MPADVSHIRAKLQKTKNPSELLNDSNEADTGLKSQSSVGHQRAVSKFGHPRYAGVLTKRNHCPVHLPHHLGG